MGDSSDAKHNPSEKCCLLDSYEVEGCGYRYPDGEKANGKFTFDVCWFQSPSAAMFYLDEVKRNSPNLLHMLQLHCKRDLGIQGDIPMAADPRLLKKFRSDGKGMTKEEYRNYGNAQHIVEQINRLPVSKRLWEDQPQENHGEPFHQTITGQAILAQKLLQEHQANGKPIPKILLIENGLLPSAAAPCAQSLHYSPQTALPLPTPAQSASLVPTPITIPAAQKRTRIDVEDLRTPPPDDDVQEVQEVLLPNRRTSSRAKNVSAK